MNRFATSAAAIALLMTSVAFAQTTDPATPDPAAPAGSQAAPATELPIPAVPGTDAGAQDSSRPMHQFEADDDDDDDDDDDGDRRRRGGDAAAGAGEIGGDAVRGGVEGDRGGRHGMRGHPGWRMHHGGMGGGMGMGGQGAVFRFSRGEGGPSIMIRCAGGDTTQECVDAIMPMLETLLQQRAGAAPAQ